MIFVQPVQEIMGLVTRKLNVWIGAESRMELAPQDLEYAANVRKMLKKHKNFKWFHEFFFQFPINVEVAPQKMVPIFLAQLPHKEFAIY